MLDGCPLRAGAGRTKQEKKKKKKREKEAVSGFLRSEPGTHCRRGGAGSHGGFLVSFQELGLGTVGQPLGSQVTGGRKGPGEATV